MATEVLMPVTNKITRDSDMELSFKEISAEMGDGYKQIAPKGINNMVESWNISWAPLTQAEYEAVLAAVKQIGTWGLFLWTPAYESTQRKFRIKKGSTFKMRRIRAGAFQCSVVLEECFDY